MKHKYTQEEKNDAWYDVIESKQLSMNKQAVQMLSAAIPSFILFFAMMIWTNIMLVKSTKTVYIIIFTDVIFSLLLMWFLLITIANIILLVAIKNIKKNNESTARKWVSLYAKLSFKKYPNLYISYINEEKEFLNFNKNIVSDNFSQKPTDAKESVEQKPTDEKQSDNSDDLTIANSNK
ncbi:UbiA prenyltransferase family protein [Mycoplasmopsis primatum]|uniref:hypothetical protein n=1 Tax=Mycoplasmopsis primatum TaxID=55604 RepID=UPI000497C7A1|nr:hypothetical protein [Mycoplasmopsis primatum]